MEDAENTWYLSSLSVWELALKHAKHPNAVPLDAKAFHDACIMAGFRDLPLSLEHIYRTKYLSTEGVYADPFDRMLLAQALTEDLVLVTHNKASQRITTNTLWLFKAALPHTLLSERT